jgi:hypothetical protein
VERERPRELRVEQGPTRCPFCHEGVAVESEAWVACEKCLARHHLACWDEGRRCAACGASAPLRRTEPVDATARLERAFADAGRPASLVPRTELPPRRSFGFEVERVLPFEVAPSARGVFSTIDEQGAIEIASGDHRTTLRLRVNLRSQAVGVLGAIGGGVGGGIGGGLSYVWYLLGGPLGVVLGISGCIFLAFALAWTVYWLVEKAARRNAEKILDAVERELATASGITPPRPRPPSPKDAV